MQRGKEGERKIKEVERITKRGGEGESIKWGRGGKVRERERERGDRSVQHRPELCQD